MRFYEVLRIYFYEVLKLIHGHRNQISDFQGDVRKGQEIVKGHKEFTEEMEILYILIGEVVT